MIPHLMLEVKFLNSMLNKLDEEMITQKIVSVMNKAIILHSGPFLKFSLIIPGDHCNAQISMVILTSGFCYSQGINQATYSRGIDQLLDNLLL